MSQEHEIHILPLDLITIGERQRSVNKEVERHIEDLRDSIQNDGLFHAIVLDSDYNLRAGWCRYNAIKGIEEAYLYASAEVSPGFIPAIITHQTDEHSLKRLELMENLQRKNLSPMDEALAVSQLHQMLKAQHGEDWTEQQTGQELDAIRGPTSHNTNPEGRNPRVQQKEVAEAQLMEAFRDDEEVRNAPTRAAAVKLVKKKMEHQMLSALGEMGKLKKSNEYIIHQSDLAAIMPFLGANAAHGIVTDPPYGMDADAFGEQAMKLGHQYADTEEEALKVAKSIFVFGQQICTDNAHLYMFCDIRLWPALCDLALTNGWHPFSTPLIWHKPGAGHAPRPGYFSRRYEAILFAEKGSRKLSRSRADIFEYSSLKDKIHAAQKPVELYQELMSLSFLPGETVLDPCAGSGTVFKAAKAAGLKAIGIEQDANYANICREVINGL